MAERVNVIDEYGVRVGHFHPDKAEKFQEDTNWNGSNHISVPTGSQWDHESLYRTAGGRWVLCSYSNRQGVLTRYSFILPDQALEWLLQNKEDEAVQRLFGEITEEEGPGPAQIGRREIGGRYTMVYGDLLKRVDARVVADRMPSRADAIRMLLTWALDNYDSPLLKVTDDDINALGHRVFEDNDMRTVAICKVALGAAGVAFDRDDTVWDQERARAECTRLILEQRVKNLELARAAEGCRTEAQK